MYQKKERKKCGLPSVLKIKRDRERENICTRKKEKGEKNNLPPVFTYTEKGQTVE